MDALRPLINSHWTFRLLIAIPAIVMLTRYFTTIGGVGHLLQSSGEWAARMLILALAVTPIRLMLKNQHWFQPWSMWMLKRRRDLGLAAFLYGLLHLTAYLIRQSSINVILYEMQFIEYILGWAALASMLILAVISNDRAVHVLGTAWKKVQRLAYVAAICVFLHWLWIKLDDVPALVHFAPLAVLEAYRLWYNFARPSGLKH
jgi:methionine sulfoxide reductase heme-binding subunit